MEFDALLLGFSPTPLKAILKSSTSPQQSPIWMVLPTS